MKNYNEYIDRLVNEKVELIISRGYFTSTDHFPEREHELKALLHQKISLAISESLVKPEPKLFEIDTTVLLGDNRKADFTLQFHLDLDKRFLEISNVKMRMNGEENTFQLSSSHELPPPDVVPGLVKFSQAVKRMISHRRIIMDNENRFGKRLN